MKYAGVNIGDFLCKIIYFDGKKAEIFSPSAEQIKSVLGLLSNASERLKFTVEFHKSATVGAEEIVYIMQFQGEDDRFVISVAKNMKLFATPNFDKILVI